MERMGGISNFQFIMVHITSTLVLVMFLALFIWAARIMWSRRRMYHMAKNIPGSFALPLIGRSYRFIGNTSDILDNLIKEQEVGELAKLWLGPDLYYLISKPEHIKKVLNNPYCINKDHTYRFVAHALGDGLLTSSDEKWKKHRRILSHSFNQRVMDSFVSIFAEQADILTDLLLKRSGQKDIPLLSILSRCTLVMTCESIMGVQINGQTTDSEFVDNLDSVMETVALRVFRVWYHPEWLWRLLPIGRDYAKKLKTCLEFISKVIERKLEVHKMKMEDIRNSSLIEEDNHKLKPFLDLILESTDFSPEELKYEVTTLMVAGTDTTASALIFFFTCLGIHKNIQEKVFEEVISVLGPDRRIEPSDMGKLQYTERVIKETLRFFPVASFFARKLDQDIDIGDAVLAKGASLFFGPVHIHRNEKYWEDPLKFDPDRFLPENVAKRHPCSYIPFSYGPRNCLGGRYAMMSMKTIISAVIRKLRFTTDYKHVADIGLSANLILRHKYGPKITVYAK